MMAYTDDQIALAAEYALGTLDVEERAQVEAMMSDDAEFRGVVEAWEHKLGVLNQMVGLTEPRAEVWDNIKAAIGLSALQAPPDSPAGSTEAVDDSAPPPPGTAAATSAVVIDFPRQARRWRNIATATSAIAAVLAVMIGVQAYRPDLLPEGLRPKPAKQQQVAQAPAAPQATAPAQFVALLQRDATSPAFILTVDAGSKNFTVRKVDATTEPGRSYELWIVSDKLQRPRSLGVIGGNDFTMRAELASYDADVVNKATYAVTVEPEGGSPTGVATGPIVYTGKLIETVPAAAPR